MLLQDLHCTSVLSMIAGAANVISPLMLTPILSSAHNSDSGSASCSAGV